MSRENLQVVRGALEAWQSDDLDTFLTAYDPAIEWHTALERVVGGIENCYRGIEGLRRLWWVYRTEQEDFQFEPQDLRDLGEDRVLFLGHIRWRGPTSHFESDSPLGMVITLRNGKIVHSVDYLSHGDALEAVGLRE
jgi:ketosteroid isomerase-like protein